MSRARKSLEVDDFFPNLREFGGMELARTADERPILAWLIEILPISTLAREKDKERAFCHAALTVAYEIRAGLSKAKDILVRRRASRRAAVVDNLEKEVWIFLDTYLPKVSGRTRDSEELLWLRGRALDRGRPPRDPGACAAEALRLFEEIEKSLHNLRRRGDSPREASGDLASRRREADLRRAAWRARERGETRLAPLDSRGFRGGMRLLGPVPLWAKDLRGRLPDGTIVRPRIAGRKIVFQPPLAPGSWIMRGRERLARIPPKAPRRAARDTKHQ